MIFEALYDSARRGELILIDGGMCRYHLRRDGQITIREIVSLRPGAGSEMLARLRAIPATRIVARCPADLPANAWYARRGFVLTDDATTSSGRRIYTWALSAAATSPGGCSSCLLSSCSSCLLPSVDGAA